MMDIYFSKALIFFSTLIGVVSTPTQMSSWKIEQNWEKVGQYSTFVASNEDIWKLCEAAPDKVISFPQIILSSQQLIVNEKAVGSTGDPSFERASAFYDRGSVSCRLIPREATVTWVATSFTQYFARFDRFPVVLDSSQFSFFADVGINVITVGALLILSLFALFIFKGKVPRRLYFPLSLGAISWAIYSAMITASFFGFYGSMLTAQKTAEFFVCLGAFFYFSFFRQIQYLPVKAFWCYNVLAIVGCIIILFGDCGDTVQFGTTVAVPGALLCFAMIFLRACLDSYRSGFTAYKLLEIISIFSFVVAGTNDLLHVIGLLPGYMILPVGAVSGVFFLAISVNREIEKTYGERDDLLRELELKVQEKTFHLTEAMESLKKSQAELVQSARLASLGTLSAGIAHEINNSINFVNGALIPLERKVMKYVSETDRKIVEKLFAAIKEGTSLTVEIVRSLRSFTGMNQAKVVNVDVQAVLTSVLTILRNKIKDVKIHCEIEPGISFVGHLIGINQVFMNLISNACDAVDPVSGQISINVRGVDDAVVISVADNGIGMPVEVAARIFDPFFTTKEVGKGTGLGLHIVKKEIDRHKGTIITESTLNRGTKFTISLPKNADGLFSTQDAQ